MPLISEIALLEHLVFKACGIELTNVLAEAESQEYAAHSFLLGGNKVKFRKAKITPTKAGQFVTIWKRNEKGITAPFDISDEYHFYLIATRKDSEFGVFVFPKEVLREKNILSSQVNAGKRGFRVYPSWDVTTNLQARKTQAWQLDYFLNLSQHKAVDLQKAMRLLAVE